ncbi:MAG: tRNA epoxyqueuosine(34) reductase QueG [Pseudomonadota bacterium]|nr:tRNA epoxyqueuosine(34) reductase QueG [Pseudomonadota bacterium]
MQQKTGPDLDFIHLAQNIRAWGKNLGFSQVGITDTNLSNEEAGLMSWLDSGFHGEMNYMAKHGSLRTKPADLLPGALSVITCRINYWPESRDAESVLREPETAYISRYALGRDYHKVMRQKLGKLADKIHEAIGDYNFRVFTDSAPVMEVALARKTGLGWRGKHTLLLSREAGSLFFLGELVTNLPLPSDLPADEHCGNCSACLDICPTKAIIAPYRLDARKCISYLTIEHRGSIPEPLRPLLGNRIYGCDDCQLICPWNRFAKKAVLPDFQVRHGLDTASLIELFAWDEATFMKNMAGTAIYRIGHTQWLRNLAVALGNAPSSTPIVNSLKTRCDHFSPLVREHVEWALNRHLRDNKEAHRHRPNHHQTLKKDG